MVTQLYSKYKTAYIFEDIANDVQKQLDTSNYEI